MSGDFNFPVYYRIYYLPNKDQFTIAELQQFDEHDYNPDYFLKDQQGLAYRFDDEEQAKKWLNENILPQYIAEDSRLFTGFSREKYFKNP